MSAAIFTHETCPTDSHIHAISCKKLAKLRTPRTEFMGRYHTKHIFSERTMSRRKKCFLIRRQRGQWVKITYFSKERLNVTNMCRQEFLP